MSGAGKIHHGLWEEPDEPNMLVGNEDTGNKFEQLPYNVERSSKDREECFKETEVVKKEVEDKANFDDSDDEEDPFGLKTKKVSVWF